MAIILVANRVASILKVMVPFFFILPRLQYSMYLFQIAHQNFHVKIRLLPDCSNPLPLLLRGIRALLLFSINTKLCKLWLIDLFYWMEVEAIFCDDA